MNKFLLCFSIAIFACSAIFSQSPQYVPYQAVARNAAGNLLVNQNVSLRFTVRETSGSGTIDYQETQSATTNNLGLFSVNVGNGTVVTGSFAGIPWGNNVAKFTQVEIDPTGGSSYTNMGAAQMMSVPYALYAGNARSVTSSNLTESTSDVLSITGGSNSVVSAAGTSIQVKKATASQDGYLSSADWTTFNSKQAALTFTQPLSNSSNTVSIGYDNSTIKMNGSNQLFAVNTGTVTGVTASNGLTSSGGNAPNITLGGTLTAATTINQAAHNLVFTGGSVGIGAATPGQLLDVAGNITVEGNYITGNSYNQNMVLMANDPNWNFGGYNSGSNYWMQSTYFDVGDGLRGFRVLDQSSGGVVFATNKTNSYFQYSNYRA
jgi:hypothetical protein